MKYLDWQKLAKIAEKYEYYLGDLGTLFDELRKGVNTTDQQPEKLIKWSDVVRTYNFVNESLKDDPSAKAAMTKEDEFEPFIRLLDTLRADVLMIELTEMKNPPEVLVDIDHAAVDEPHVGGQLVEITDPSGQSDLRLSFYVFDVDGEGQMSLLPADLVDKDC